MNQAPEAAGRLAARVAAAVAGCPGVVSLRDGPVGTYLPGQVVTGVALRGGSVVVAVTVTAARPLAETAGQIRARLADVVPGRPVDVLIEDIDLNRAGRPG